MFFPAMGPLPPVPARECSQRFSGASISSPLLNSGPVKSPGPSSRGHEEYIPRQRNAPALSIPLFRVERLLVRHHLVDEPVPLRLVRPHEVVAIGVFLDPLDRLPRV